MPDTKSKNSTDPKSTEPSKAKKPTTTTTPRKLPARKPAAKKTAAKKPAKPLEERDGATVKPHELEGYPPLAGGSGPAPVVRELCRRLELDVQADSVTTEVARAVVDFQAKHKIDPEPGGLVVGHDTWVALLKHTSDPHA